MSVKKFILSFYFSLLCLDILISFILYIVGSDWVVLVVLIGMFLLVWWFFLYYSPEEFFE